MVRSDFSREDFIFGELIPIFYQNITWIDHQSSSGETLGDNFRSMLSPGDEFPGPNQAECSVHEVPGLEEGVKGMILIIKFREDDPNNPNPQNTVTTINYLWEVSDPTN